LKSRGSVEEVTLSSVDVVILDGNVHGCDQKQLNVLATSQIISPRCAPMKFEPKVARGVKDVQRRAGPVSTASQVLSKGQTKIEDPRAVSLFLTLLRWEAKDEERCALPDLS